MDVDARPNEIVRLWPKLPSAAAPEYVIDFMPATPIALDAASITAFASSAPAARGLAERASATSAVTAAAFTINRPPDGSNECGGPAGRGPRASATGGCAVARLLTSR